MYQINETNRTIKVLEETSAENLVKTIQSDWLDKMHLPFPFYLDEKKDFVIVNGWSFDGISSHLKITPRIFPLEIKQIPKAPERFVLYKPIQLREPFTLESLLSQLPKKIPYRSVHLKIRNNNLFAHIDGTWPNEDFSDQVDHYKTKISEIERVTRYKDMITKYEKKEVKK